MIEIRASRQIPYGDRQQAATASAVWAAAWPLVPHSRTLERPTLGSVRSFCANGNANVPYIHATSL